MWAKSLVGVVSQVFSPALQATTAILKISLRSLVEAINSHKDLLSKETDTATVATARERMEVGVV